MVGIRRPSSFQSCGSNVGGEDVGIEGGAADHRQNFAVARIERHHCAAAAVHGQFRHRLQIEIEGELQSFAGGGFFLSSTSRSRIPRRRPPTRRSPSTPVRVSLYWRSRPILPTLSPCEYLANSSVFSSIFADFADVADHVRG